MRIDRLMEQGPSGMRSSRSFTGLVIIALAATISLAGPAQADEPLRSGTIVGGYVILTGPPPCSLTVDCAPWLAACDPRLAGRDLGVFSSIVDIGEFAGTRRTLELSSTWLAGVVEFWTEDCRRLSGFVPEDDRTPLRVSAAAFWMSITAGTPILHWELW